MPPSLAPLVERYLEIYQGYEPADARYLENHRGHLMLLRPEDDESFACRAWSNQNVHRGTGPNFGTAFTSCTTQAMTT